MTLETTDKAEKPKTFSVVATIETRSVFGAPYITDTVLEAETLGELKSRMNGFEAVTIGQSKELGRKITIKFAPIMRFDTETERWNTIEGGAKKGRSWLAKILGHTSEIIPSVFPKEEE